jgi:hypothetical protein
MFRTDVAHIRTVLDKDPSFRKVPSERLRKAEDLLWKGSSADDFRLALMAMVASAENGHTRAIANEVATVAPLRMVWTADGPCIGAGAYRGARLLTINGMAMAEVFAQLRPLLAGTLQRARALGAFMLAWPPAVALATDSRSCPCYVFETCAGTPLEIVADATTAAVDLYPLRERGFADYLISGQGLSSLEEAPGLFLRRLEGGRSYVRIGDLGAQPPDGIAAELHSILLDLSGSRAVVVDLRGNPGGDFFGALDFARRLPIAAPTSPVTVLVDKYTFSAALVTAALLKIHAGARIAGEEMGDVGRFYAEGGTMRLQESGMLLRYSDGWHDWETGTPDPLSTPPEIAAVMVPGGSLRPDLPVPLSSHDLAACYDRVLEAALRSS